MTSLQRFFNELCNFFKNAESLLRARTARWSRLTQTSLGSRLGPIRLKVQSLSFFQQCSILLGIKILDDTSYQWCINFELQIKYIWASGSKHAHAQNGIHLLKTNGKRMMIWAQKFLAHAQNGIHLLKTNGKRMMIWEQIFYFFKIYKRYTLIYLLYI